MGLLEVEEAGAALVEQTARMEMDRKQISLLLAMVAQEALTAVAVGTLGTETITHGTHQPKSLT